MTETKKLIEEVLDYPHLNALWVKHPLAPLLLAIAIAPETHGIACRTDASFKAHSRARLIKAVEQLVEAAEAKKTP